MNKFSILLILAALLLLIAAGGAVVWAASLGEDFEWVATTTDGVRIGGSGQGDVPQENTLEFVLPNALIEFTQGGAIQFGSSGLVLSEATMVSGAAGPAYPAAGVMMHVAASGPGEGGTVILGANTRAGMAYADAWWEGLELVLDVKASVACTPEGNLVVTLGGTPALAMGQPAPGFSAATRDFLAPARAAVQYVERVP